jgi:hypothetical protein
LPRGESSDWEPRPYARLVLLLKAVMSLHEPEGVAPMRCSIALMRSSNALIRSSRSLFAIFVVAGVLVS